VGNDIARPGHEPRRPLESIARLGIGRAPRFIFDEILSLQECAQLCRSLADIRRTIADRLQQVDGSLMVRVGGMLAEHRNTDSIVLCDRSVDRCEHHRVLVSHLSGVNGGSQELFGLLKEH